MKILHDTRYSWIWLLVRVWLGYQWLEAGWHKLTDPAGLWVGAKAGLAIKGFWLKGAGLMVKEGQIVQAVGADGKAIPPGAKYEWYQSFLAALARGHHEVWFSYLIAYGEFLVGVALILGFLTTFAALMGALMNLNFMLAGTASTNPVLYTLAILIIAAGVNAGYLGVDHYLLPYLRRLRSEKPSGASTVGLK